jgi:UDP-N-acetylmuramoylalanine--D-glutamate ligase
MRVAGKRILVVGLAQTGISVARFCQRAGAEVTVTDAKPATELAAQITALDGVAELELGGHRIESFTTADFVVMSPGVPELPEVQAARAAGVEVMAEIELAYRCMNPNALLVAITGTNGKSTTTALTGSLCAASGRPTFCGGNLGNHPLIEAVGGPADVPGGFVIAEVAGFMLETCSSFRPRVAACLNITPDHLDRYGTMEVYSAMKTRVFRWQTSEDVAIANANDQRTLAGARSSSARVLLFDSQTEVEQGAFLAPGGRELVLRRVTAGEKEERYRVADLPLIGVHNLENAMAAYLAARSIGVAPDAIRDGARVFTPQPHRMELVAEKNGIAFYDDSKGTNVAAVAASIRGFPRPVILIAGGVDKGGSYKPMFEALAKVARGIVLIGEAAPLIRTAAREFGVAYPVVDAKDMPEAVASALELAQPGDAVVLSPACSSYDMFKNFKERGHAFRSAVADRLRAL